MPTYDYLCEKCGTFEHVQRMSDAALTICPTCGSKASRQISSAVNFVFKGSGFYTTDYRSDAYAESEKAEKSSPAAEVSKSEVKNETKKEAVKDAPKTEVKKDKAVPGKTAASSTE